MEEICREGSRLISCLMTRHGSSLLHGSQDCICLIQMFLVSLKALPKMAFWPLLFPSPPLLSTMPLLTVPQSGLVYPYIFVLAAPAFFVRNAHHPLFCPLSSYSPFKVQYKCHLFCDYFPTSGQSQHLWHCGCRYVFAFLGCKLLEDRNHLLIINLTLPMLTKE